MVVTDGVDVPPVGDTTDDANTERWIDRLGPATVHILTAVGLVLPVFSYLWLVSHYGVNVIEGDQWDDVTVIRASHAHLVSWGALWAQHNENRIFFPNLLVVLMSRTTHFNIKIEEYLSACMLIAAAALILLTHKRRSSGTPWLYYVPAVVLLFSFAQFGNTLWGFQMAWYLVLLAFAATLFIVDRLSLSWAALGLAVVVAVIGSFSSLQGLLIWPVGLLLLYHRARSWAMRIAWIAAGVVSTALYMYHFNDSTAASPHNLALTHPLPSAKFFLFALGDILGYQIQYLKPPSIGIITFGIVLFLLAVIALVLYGIRRDETGPGPIGVCLICMGFLFALTVTEGRIIFGYFAAGASRYTTFDLLVPVGIYLSFLSRPRLGLAATPGSTDSGVTASSQLLGREPKQPRSRPWVERSLPVIRVVVLALIVLQVAFSLPNGVKGARSHYVYDTKGAEVLRDIDHESNAALVYYVSVFDSAAFIRHQARTLEKFHLSVFADGDGNP